MKDWLNIERLAQHVQGRTHSVELQSVRGIAALVVVLLHCSYYFNYNENFKFILSVIFNAHASVVIFFVLSGYVLTLSLLRKEFQPVVLADYYIRRIFRIYPALIAAVLLALLYVFIFNNMHTTTPVDDHWWTPGKRRFLSKNMLIASFLGVTTTLPLPIWTLFIEIVCSFFLPILIFSVRKKIHIFPAIILLSIIAALYFGTLGRYTVLYATGFVFGCAIVVSGSIFRNIEKISLYSIYGLASFGFLILWFGRLLFNSDFGDNYHDPFSAVIEGVGAMLVIGTISYFPSRFSALRHSSLAALGDISFSLYLVHMPILGLVAGIWLEVLRLPAGNPIIATAILTMLTLGISIPLSALLYRYLEVPMIDAGKIVARRARAGLAAMA